MIDLDHITEPTNAIDLSDGTYSDAVALAAPALMIQDLWTGDAQPAPRVTNLRTATQHGKTIAAFAAISSGRDAAYHAGMARAGVPYDLYEALAFVAVDLELSGVPLADAIAFGDLLAPRPDAPRVLYTRHDFYVATYGDAPLPPDWWLWDARYALGGVIPPYRPYAGVGADRLLGVQTEGTHDLAGCAVDSDVFDLSRLQGGDSMEPIAQTVAARCDLAGAALKGDMADLVAKLIYFGVLPAGTTPIKPAL